MIDIDRLAMAALRGVVQELEGDPAGARAALAALLAPTPTPAAPVVQRDRKPANTKRPAARRRVARPARPAPAASVEADPEAARLVGVLIEKHGSARAAARVLGTSPPMVRRWARGAGCKAETVERLRAAVEGEGADCDAKPGNVTPEPTDVAALVAAIDERHGLGVACERFGLNLAAVQRWRSGAPCSPASVARLRSALEAAPFTTKRERAPREAPEVDAAHEAALPHAIAAALAASAP